MIDPRALDILFHTFWTPSGWRNKADRVVPLDDFEFAKRVGVMFDPVLVSHEDLVRRAIAIQNRISPVSVADAFLASLSARQPHLRSALGSFAVLRHFPPHKFVNAHGRCITCGLYDLSTDPYDLNALSFERFKWGGVRHLDLLYAVFDCEQFAKLQFPKPLTTDIELLYAVLHVIKTVPPGTTSAVLQKHLAKVLPSNKSERDILVGILGLCGILATPGYPSFFERYITAAARELPPRRFVDMEYPACWWKATDGIDWEALSFWFGHVLG